MDSDVIRNRNDAELFAAGEPSVGDLDPQSPSGWFDTPPPPGWLDTFLPAGELLVLDFLPSLPLEEHAFVFAIAVTAFLVAPLAIKRAGLPGIIGIVLVGAIIGPNAVGIVDEHEAIVLLGNAGLVYLLFTVGLELDLRGFAKAPENAALFGLASFGIPFVAGVIGGVVLLDFDIWAASLLAAVFASHTLLAYPIVNRLGITQNRAVTAVFGGILFTDTLALIVLALVLGGAEGGLSPTLIAQVFVSLALLFGAIWLLVPRIARWFFQTLSEESYFEFLFVLAVLFLAASLAEVLDIADILGAFVAGLALNRVVPRGGTLMNRIQFVGNALFIPFFLLYVGMQVDPRVILDGPRTLQVAAFIVVTMVVAKFAAAWLVSSVQGYDPNERGVIFGLSVGQAAAALAITLVGFEAGLFGSHVVNAVVLMLLVTATISPWLTERYGTQLVAGEEVEPGGASEATDPRILVPLSTDADRQRALLELAFVLKDDWGEQPVHLLTVVQPTSGGADADVETVAQSLEDAAEIGGAAEVPVIPETRVNHNVASGIVRGSLEVRADLILIGWDANPSLRSRMFGGIIDQVLDRTKLPVVVSRLGHPINTTTHLYVVIPGGIDHHEGFYEAVHVVKQLAAQLGVGVTGLVVDGSARQYERLFGLVETEADATFEEISTWDALVSELDERIEPDDLVVGLSPREGSVGWNDALAYLPSRLHGLPPNSFIMVYPREGEPEYDAQFLKIE